MNIKELELEGLELVDPNADYSGTQTISTTNQSLVQSEYSFTSNDNLGILAYSSIPIPDDPEEEPELPPENLLANSIGQSITVSWDMADDSNVTGYYITVSSNSDLSNGKIYNSLDNYERINDLAPGRYYYSVTAIYESGSPGPASEIGGFAIVRNLDDIIFQSSFNAELYNGWCNLSVSAGISLEFNIGPIPFSVSDVAIQSETIGQNKHIRFCGKFGIEIGKSECTFDLSGDKYFELVLDSDDNIIDWEISTTVTAKGFSLGGLKFKNVSVDIDTSLDNYKFSADIDLMKVTIGCTAEWENGSFDMIELRADDMDKAIGTTGVFLESISANIDNLSSSAISVGACASFYYGFQFRGYSLLTAEANVEIDKHHFEGNASFNILGDIAAGSGAIDLNWDKGELKLAGELNFLDGVITTTTDINLDSKGNFSFSSSAEVDLSLSAWIFDISISFSGDVYCTITNDNDDTNDYIMAYVTLNNNKSYGVKYNFDGESGTFRGWSKIGGNEIEKLLPAFATPTSESNSTEIYSATSGAESYTNYDAWYIAEGEGTVLFSVNWTLDVEDVEINLISSDGTIYDQDAIVASSSMYIVEEMSISQSMVIAVDTPSSGTWELETVSAVDLSNNIDFSATSLFSALEKPEISIASVNSRQVELNYQVFSGEYDLTTGLYYDNDNLGYDGIMVDASLVESLDGVYAWSALDDLAGGDYYFYLVTHDENHAPVMSDYSTVANIVGNKADLAAQDISLNEDNGSSFILSWNAVNIGDVASSEAIYKIVLSENNDITISDYELAAINIAGLSAGAELTQNTVITLPTDFLFTNDCYISIIADSASAENEGAGEYNNILSSSITTLLPMNSYGDNEDNIIDGSVENNSIYGAGGNDTITGLAGDDYLNGYQGNDIYVINSGDGNDIIDDGYDEYGELDSIQFGEGISINNLIFNRSGDDLIITVNSSEQTITVKDQYEPAGRINSLSFADGIVVGYQDFQYLLDDSIAPTTPDLISVTTDDNYNSFFDWDDSQDNENGAGIKEYILQYSDSLNLYDIKTIKVSESELNIEDITMGNYYYRVKSIDNAGNDSEWGMWDSFTIDNDSITSLSKFGTWNQSGGVYLGDGGKSDIVYNEYTPHKRYVGCVPTATGQLLYYWGLKQKQLDINFTVDSLQVDSNDYFRVDGASVGGNDYAEYNFLSYSELNDKLINIDYEFSADEIAALSFAVGAKVNANYELQTGAYSGNVNSFLQEIGFNATYATASTVNVEEEIIDDISKGQVVYLEVWASSVGHAILVDGYNSSDNTFHFNMGWGGASDGWSSLADIPGGFNTIDSIIYNITPTEFNIDDYQLEPLVVSSLNDTVNNDSATLSWDHSSFNNPSFKEYIVEYSKSSQFIFANQLTLTDNELNLTGLSDGTYYWRVKAIDKIGEQTASTPDKFTIDYSSDDTVIMSKPESLTDEIYNNSAKLDWLDSSNNNSEIKEYIIEFSDFYDFITASPQVVTDSELILSDLSDGTYYWRVKSKDIDNNESDWSIKNSFLVGNPSPAISNDALITILENGAKKINNNWAYGFNAIDGNNFVIGSSRVYSYRWNGSSYDEYQLSTQAGADKKSISIDGDRIAVATNGDFEYVYHWNGSSYDEYQINSDCYNEKSIAIDGDIVAISSDNGIYTYRWNGNSYEEQNVGLPTDKYGVNYGFNTSIALDDNNIAIGTYDDIYSYRWNGNSYDEYEISLKSYSITGHKIAQGTQVRPGRSKIDVDGDTIVVGCEQPDSDGCVLVYRWNGSNYSEYTLLPSDGNPDDIFGSSVAIDGDNIVVGAMRDDANGLKSGSAYVYHWNGDYYDEYKILADNTDLDYFGAGVAIDINTVMVDKYLFDVNDILSRPSIPVDLFCKVVDSNVIIDWSDSVNENIIKEYIVEYSLNSDFSDSTIFTAEDSESTINDLDDGTYFWRVKTVDYSGGESHWHNGSSFKIGYKPNETSIQTFANGVQKITASDGVADGKFGSRVSLNVNNIAIGAPAQSDCMKYSSAYIYRWNGDTYDEYKLTSSNDDLFYGEKVAIDYNTVAVTARGSIYIYSWNGEYYEEKDIITETSPTILSSVAVEDNTVVVGSKPSSVYSDENSGVCIYSWNDNSYDKYEFTTSDAHENQIFGREVAIDNGVVVVSASNDYDGDFYYEGSVYVYRWNGIAYDEVKLTASDDENKSNSFNGFGNAIAIDGNTIVVGFKGDYGDGGESGSAYVYRWNGEAYNEIKLIAFDGSMNDNFGGSVAVDGDIIVVGASGNDVGNSYDSGSAYVYYWNGNEYLVNIIIAPDKGSGDEFGYSVAVERDTIVVGSREDNNSNGTDAGGVYIFNVNNIFANNIVESGVLLENEVVSDYALNVCDGGRTENVSVSNGGQIIHSGGVADSTTLNSQGIMNISSGGVANNTQIKSYGIQKVYEGGIANDTTIVGFWSEQIVRSGGVVNNTVIEEEGTQTVLAGGVAVDTTIKSGGSSFIESGATATRIIQQDGGILYTNTGATITGGINSRSDGFSNFSIENGIASNFLLNERSELEVKDGHSATNTIVDGGTLRVCAGATVTGVYQQSGSIDFDFGATILDGINNRTDGFNEFSLVDGVASNFLLESEHPSDPEDGLNITDGFSAVNTMIGENEVLYVSSGGVATGTILNDWGRLKVSSGGAANNTSINSGGQLTVEAGAIASVINQYSGGTLTAFSGATITGGVNGRSDGYNEFSIINGLASNFLLERGGLWIEDGDTAFNTLLKGGGLYLSNGTAINTIIESGGKLTVRAGSMISGELTVNGGTVETYSEVNMNSDTDEINLKGNADLSSAFLSLTGGGDVNISGVLNDVGNMTITGGGNLNFDISDIAEAETENMLVNYANLTADSITISTDSNLVSGIYELAGNAFGFDQSIGIYLNDTSIANATLANDLVYNDITYNLNLEDDNLILLVSGAAELPEIPTTLSDVVTSNSVILDWADSSDNYDGNGVEYVVQYADNDSFDGAFNETITASKLDLSNLTDGTYYWRVKSVDNNDNTSGWSITDNFMIDTGAPVIPGGLTDSVTNASVLLDWSDSTDDVSGIKKYIVEYADNSGLSDATSQTVNASELNLTGLTDMTTYYWQVKSVDNNGNASSWSTTDSFAIDIPDIQAPAIPSGLVDVVNGSSVSLDWNDSTDNKSGVKEYVVEYANNTEFTDAKSKNVTSSELNLSNLSSGTTYWHVKTIDNNNNISEWSTMDSFSIMPYGVTKLTASDGDEGDWLGGSVSVDGNTIVVGALGDDDNGNNSGSAYAYRWNGTSYDEHKLIASDGAQWDQFGYAVTVGGDTIVIGARGDDDNGDNSGSAYVYRWDGTSYDEYKLLASDGEVNDEFGRSPAVGDNTIVIGSDSYNNCGCAYVYRWNGMDYDEHKLIASDSSEGDLFGRSIAMDGDNIVVGTWSSDNVYIYHWNGVNYDEIKLTASDGAENDCFGQSVAIDNNTIVVGASDDDDNGLDSGSAYVYRWNGSNYDEIKLTASDGSVGDYFGRSVSIEGDNIVVGAYGDDDNGDASGSAYLYHWNGSNYDETKLTAPDGEAGDYFGRYVSIDNDNIVINGDGTGNAYVFELSKILPFEHVYNATEQIIAEDAHDYSLLGANSSQVFVRDVFNGNSSNPTLYIYNHGNYDTPAQTIAGAGQYSAAIDDTWMIIPDNNSQDKVYIYGQTNKIWELTQTIAVNANSRHLAVDSDLLAIGGTDWSTSSSSVDLYIYVDSQWQEFENLEISFEQSGIIKDITVDNDWIFIGAQTSTGTDYWVDSTFETYVYKRESSELVSYGALEGLEGYGSAEYKKSMDIDGNFAAVIPNNDGNTTDEVFIYQLDNNDWNLFQVINTPFITHPEAVSLKGNTLIVADNGNISPTEEDYNWSGEGYLYEIENSSKAYVYKFDGNSWNYSETLAPDENYLRHGDEQEVFIGGTYMYYESENQVISVYEVVTTPDSLTVDISDNDVTFSWSAVSDTSKVSYEYCLDDDIDFSSLVSQNETTDATFNINNLTDGKYYWKVRSVDSVGNKSAWSETGSFGIMPSGVTKLTASGEVAYSHFGYSLSVSDDNIVVGADGGGGGSAYVYRWNGSGYDEYTITASDRPADQDYEFGDAVFISGDTVLVGAHQDDDNGFYSGSAYIYQWNGESYEEIQKLTASDGKEWGGFGDSLSISGNNILIGAAWSNNVYVYSLNGSVYEETQIITAPGDVNNNNFGGSIFTLNDIMVVGSSYSNPEFRSGNAYVYQWNGEAYEGIQTLSASDGATEDSFGYSVSISGNYLAIGADRDDDNGSDSGSVYVYQWNGESYDEIQKISASDGTAGDNFGGAVSISGDYLAVGACYNNENGSAYLYHWNGESYDEIKKVTASDGGEDDRFGISVTISDDTLIVGTKYGSPDDGTNLGSAYVFDLDKIARPKAVTEDFDGNSKSDILFTKGNYIGYYADGLPSGWQDLGSYASGWEVTGRADFDSNGKTDILFTDGTYLGYYADGLPSGWKDLGSYASGWEVTACADFDGNGKDDILFTDGTYLGYYADGLPSGWKDLGSYASGWEVTSCADFDGNGQSDILFTDGTYLGYYADGLPSGWKDLGSYASGWDVKDCADFDGNGKDDILFNNGNFIGYYADGLPSGWKDLGSYASGWSVKDCADFDGNGKDDILFNNGNFIGYYADGLPSGWKDLGSYSSGWEIVVA